MSASSVSLDPRKAHSSHVYGDILCILTWVNDERAMVLMPAKRRPGAPWYIVCDSAAWKYDDPHYLARQARKAAEVLGMDETTSTWFRIATIIHDGLADLIRMPHAPDPELAKGAIGEMKLMADGVQIAGMDIRPEVEGMTFVQ